MYALRFISTISTSNKQSFAKSSAIKAAAQFTLSTEMLRAAGSVDSFVLAPQHSRTYMT